MIKPIFRLTPRKAVLVIFAISLSFFVLGLSSAYADDYQIVTLSATPANPTMDDTINVEVDYDVSTGNKMLSGIKLRVCYDATKLAYAGYDNYLDIGGYFQVNPDVNGAKDDSEDLDNDPSTTKYLIINWGDVSAEFPGNDKTLPVKLVDLKFTPLSEATSNVNVKIDETAGGYSAEEHNTTVTVTCPTATIDSFSADSTEICSGGDGATLSWSVSNATGVTLDDGTNNPVTVEATGSQSVTPTETTTYTLAATNSCGTVTKDVAITVNDPPTVDTFTGTATICSGDSTNLSWSTTGASKVTIDDGSGAVEVDASNEGYSVSPTVTTTYTLTATNGCGTDSKQVTVNVNSKPVIHSFTGPEAAICSGDAATLSWDVTGADTLTIDDGSGPIPVSGTSKTVSPTTTTTYTLVATNDNGCGSDTKTVTVTVNDTPVITTFSASPATICKGESTDLSWIVSPGATISIDHGVDAGAGNTVSVSPTTTTIYTLTASNGSCQATKTVTVTVNDAPVISAFTATPATICKGETTTLSSTVSGASTITIDHGVGGVGGGTSSAVVSPDVTTTYTITASNGACQVTKTVTVTVNDKPVITSFTATPSSVIAGDAVTLSWAITGADSAKIDETGVDAGTGTITVNPAEDTTYTLTATNGCGDTTSKATVKIIVNNPPDKPEMVSPTDGATDVSLMPELKAGAYKDADGDPHTMTWWQIATDNLFSEDSLVYDEKTDTHLTSIVVPPDLVLEPLTMYYWRVRYYDGKNWSDSDVYSFTTASAGPEFIDGVRSDDMIGDGQSTLSGFTDSHNNPVNTDSKKTFIAKHGNVQIGIEAKNGAKIEKCGSIDPKELGEVPRVPHMPYGLIELALTVPNAGDTATVTIHFSNKLPHANDFVWWKYDPNRGEFYDYAAAAAEEGMDHAVVLSPDRMSVTLKFKDGGVGDLVKTPDGMIIDPSGPGDEGGGSSGGTCFIHTLRR